MAYNIITAIFETTTFAYCFRFYYRNIGRAIFLMM